MLTSPKVELFRRRKNSYLRTVNHKKNFYPAASCHASPRVHRWQKCIAEISREKCVSQAAFCKWRQRYNGMDATELKRLTDVEEENRRLKARYAELAGLGVTDRLPGFHPPGLPGGVVSPLGLV
jgi:hypothetical protein